MPIAIAPSVLFREFGDQAVLLHLDTERYFSLNDSALRMWTLLTSGHDVDATAAIVSEEFDVDVATAAADVRTLMTALVARGLAVGDGGE